MPEQPHNEGSLLEQVHKRWDEQFEEVRLEGREEGREEERVRHLAIERRLIVRWAAGRFGEDEAASLKESLEGIDDPVLIDTIGGWVAECGSAAELDERIRSAMVRRG